jgi:ubiquinone/menaquinone biosynthesis C-methylase UbiE/uncharacterized protein YbaR (Trm112 family)
MEGSPPVGRFGSLQSILCCPRAKTELRLVPLEELLSWLAEGQSHRLPDGTIGAFISEAAQQAYPLTNKVAYFLDQSSLKIQNITNSGNRASSQKAVDEVTRSVQLWYDAFGWKTNDAGFYNDSALFSQAVPVGHGLYELMSHMSILDRLPGGNFVLDAASGAIPHPEYLAFSWYFKSRVCVDFSITALHEASEKLQDSDFCCLADICYLPFKDNSFDGAVSGYTIQHVPEHLQMTAINELLRVIRPKAHLCILTSVEHSIWHKGFSRYFGPRGLMKRLTHSTLWLFGLFGSCGEFCIFVNLSRYRSMPQVLRNQASTNSTSLAEAVRGGRRFQNSLQMNTPLSH